MTLFDIFLTFLPCAKILSKHVRFCLDIFRRVRFPTWPLPLAPLQTGSAEFRKLCGPPENLSRLVVDTEDLGDLTATEIFALSAKEFPYGGSLVYGFLLLSDAGHLNAPIASDFPVRSAKSQGDSDRMILDQETQITITNSQSTRYRNASIATCSVLIDKK